MFSKTILLLFVAISHAQVTWTVNPPVGTITPDGVYTAPATVPAPITITIRATSVADPAKSATAVVTLEASPPPVVVTLQPAAARLRPGASQRFTATVTGGGPSPLPPLPPLPLPTNEARFSIGNHMDLNIPPAPGLPISVTRNGVLLPFQTGDYVRDGLVASPTTRPWTRDDEVVVKYTATR